MPIDWDELVLEPLEGVFAEPATYTPAGGTPFQINGVFDRYHREDVLLDPSVPVNVLHVVFGVRLAAFPADVSPAPNDALNVASVGINYVVKDVQLDGHGAAKLVLQRTA